MRPSKPLTKIYFWPMIVMDPSQFLKNLCRDRPHQNSCHNCAFDFPFTANWKLQICLLACTQRWQGKEGVWMQPSFDGGDGTAASSSLTIVLPLGLLSLVSKWWGGKISWEQRPSIVGSELATRLLFQGGSKSTLLSGKQVGVILRQVIPLPS